MDKRELIKNRRMVIGKYLTVFWSTFLFVFMALFLRKYGYIKNFNLSKMMSEPKMREDTKITIADNNIKNKALAISANKIYLLEDKQEKIELVSENGITSPGILEDGRIYFWKKKGSEYAEVFLQKGEIFEKVKVNTGRIEKTPTIFPDGNSVVYLSDKESVGNFKKNDMYIYDLNSFQGSKILTNEFMNIEEVRMSPNSNLIAFSYDFIKANSQKDLLSLGVVVSRNTVNLFSEVKLKGDFQFSLDSKNIIMDSEEGVAVFNLETGKISQVIEKMKLTDNNGKQFLLSKVEEEKEICQRPTIEYNFYEFNDGKLIQKGKLKSANYLARIEEAHIFSWETQEVIGRFQDRQNCEEVFGILNWESDNLTKVEEEGEVFFAL